MEKNIIKINEDFEMYQDKHQWILWHWTDGVCKKGEDKGKSIRVKRATYHGTMQQVCDVIINRSLGKCESLADMKDLLENAVTMLAAHVETYTEGK